MTVLGTATKVYAGSQVARKVYLGATLVWPLVAPPVGDPVTYGQGGDWVTRGWGTSGHLLADVSLHTVLPPGVSASTGGAARYTWAQPITESHGMRLPPPDPSLGAFTWYSNDQFTITFTFAQAWSGTIRAYHLSLQNDTRTVRVQAKLNSVVQNEILLDYTNSATWFGSGQQIPAMLPGGRWIGWDVVMKPGGVLEIVNINAGGPLESANAVVAGYVFDAAVQPFSPTDITGLVTWLDAAHYTPGAWPNKGTGPAVTIAGTPVMTNGALGPTGLPTVRFKTNEGKVRSVWNGNPIEWTLVYLVRWVGPNAGRAFTAQYPPSNLLVGMHTAQRDSMYNNGTWIYSQTLGTAWDWTAPGPWRMYGADSTTSMGSRFFVDGVEIGSPVYNVGATEGLYNGWAISGYGAGNEETMDIEVAEFLLWDRKLTDPEREQAEDYLHGKWLLS